MILTADGTFTVFHPLYGEPYHSVTAGALTECLEKFLYPSGILQRAKEKREIRILDIGFGLGYNVAVAIKHLRDENRHLQIYVLSFEKELMENPPLLPEPYGYYQRLLWENLPAFEKEGISFKLLLGDARKKITEVSSFEAHVVFHDAFSPLKNPELWTLQFLLQVKRLMDIEGVWISYTSSLAVRKSLWLLGFNLQTTASVGRRRGGTKAGLSIPTLLSPQEMHKLLHSPFSVPLEDHTLEDDPSLILTRYNLRVEHLKAPL
ncbi:protein of unknown function DUF752 [Thermocrinis albus DSM 14484]|uniref:MnmC-like methyltransferase domain-containing protein n=1 Tax=Thermocrinis albus (strain DSM 14484 / JCM 11386 / HI 11/12) TaxID=638303 RepID=D3SMH9_THEAH|nr:MnmC family methyltransferase [Thermocrinis albus]ADC89959.1 protein of unknown function DUF752 [Thermocrinis albus DSM 14484]